MQWHMEGSANEALKLFATQALTQTQKNLSEPQTGIEPAWATRTSWRTEGYVVY